MRTEPNAFWPRFGIWLAVWSTTPSLSQAAIVACGSIWAWIWFGVTYSTSSFTGAAAKAASKSPSLESGGELIGFGS